MHGLCHPRNDASADCTGLTPASGLLIAVLCTPKRRCTRDCNACPTVPSLRSRGACTQGLPVHLFRCCAVHVDNLEACTACDVGPGESRAPSAALAGAVKQGPHPGGDVPLVVQEHDQELARILSRPEPARQLGQRLSKRALVCRGQAGQAGLAAERLGVPLDGVAQEGGDHVDCAHQQVEGRRVQAAAVRDAQLALGGAQPPSGQHQTQGGGATHAGLPVGPALWATRSSRAPDMAALRQECRRPFCSGPASTRCQLLPCVTYIQTTKGLCFV